MSKSDITRSIRFLSINNMMQHNADLNEKRSGTDRREKKIPHIKYLLFGGRRKGGRRNSDHHEIVLVDRYSPRLLIVVLSVVILSLGDGFFTLYLTGHGAQELNPLMDYFLKLNPWVFLAVKFILTTAGVICILILSNTRFRPFNIRVSSLFTVLLTVFLMVIIWQVSLKYLMQI